MSEQMKKTLAMRRNFKLKFTFEEDERNDKDEVEEADERTNKEEDERNDKDEVEETDERTNKEEDEGKDKENVEEENFISLKFQWSDVREKFLRYTPQSVLQLTSTKELSDVLRWYNPPSQPHSSQEFVYLALICKAAEKRLAELK